MDYDCLSSLDGLHLDRSDSKPARLYLSLVYAHGEAGTKKRIEIAQVCVSFPFGVATECGLARTS